MKFFAISLFIKRKTILALLVYSTDWLRKWGGYDIFLRNRVQNLVIFLILFFKCIFVTFYLLVLDVWLVFLKTVTFFKAELEQRFFKDGRVIDFEGLPESLPVSSFLFVSSVVSFSFHFLKEQWNYFIKDWFLNTNKNISEI